VRGTDGYRAFSLQLWNRQALVPTHCDR
jgi:hypothetical protein